MADGLFVPNPSHCQVKLPFTGLIGEPVVVGAGKEQASHIRIKVPASKWSWPVAELRLSRAFAEKPVDLMAEVSTKADFPASATRLYGDAEKIIFTEGGEYFVRVWGELGGVPRDSFPRSALTMTRMALVFERLLLGGIPTSCLPVLLLILITIGGIYWWAVPAFISLIG